MFKARALSATFWSGLDICLRQGLQFCMMVVLMRLLAPSDFGTIALLSLFIGIATTIVDGGFSVALIQNQNVNHTDESTVFWFNLLIGLIMTASLWLMAPVFASFYEKTVLIPLMRLMALNMTFSALGAIHRTLLMKRLNFRLPMLIGVFSVFISGTVAVVMALRGLGVWSLAVQAVVLSGMSTLLLWVFHQWRPLLVWSNQSARKLFSFGGYHLGAGLLDVVYARLYTILIGKFYSAKELGFYNNADTAAQLPGGLMVGVLGRVALPMFAEIASDKERLRYGVRLVVRGMMLVYLPLMLGMLSLSTPIVEALFGTKWLPAIPILRVLCIAVLFLPLHIINLNALLAQGRSGLMFKMETIKKVIGVCFICAGSLFGLMGVAWSQVAFNLLAFFINAYYTGKFLNYGAMAQIRDFSSVLVVALVMATLVYTCSLFWPLAAVAKLLVLTSGGAAFFLFFSWLCRLEALHDVMVLFRQVRSSVAKIG